MNDIKIYQLILNFHGVNSHCTCAKQDRLSETRILRKMSALTHLFPVHPFLPPENIRKRYGFLTFPGGRERVHWEQMS